MKTPMQQAVILYQKVAARAAQDEQDTLTQVEFVAAALKRLGYRTAELPISLNLEKARKAIVRMKPDFVFNLVESIGGRGEFIFFATQLLDTMRLPYTGAGTTAMFLSSNKLLAKSVMKTAGIPTPALCDPRAALADASGIRFPVIVKNIWEHASIGIDDSAVLRDPAALAEKMRAPEGKYLEEYIDGREIEVPLLETEDGVSMLPPSEIKFTGYPEGKPKIVGYEAKWVGDSFEYNNTPASQDFAPEDKDLLEEIKLISLKCWEIFKLSGYARVDFRVDKTGNPYVLEINANPCLSPDAGFFASASEAGYTSKTLVEAIVRACLKKEI